MEGTSEGLAEQYKTHTKKQENSGHSRPPQQQRTSSYKINSKDEIFQHLSKLRKNHTLLSIKVGESALNFGSIILDINKQDAFIILDELFPRNKISTSVLHQKLKIKSQIDGIDLSFVSIVNSVLKEDGSNYCKLAIPKFMYYFQRREFFRATTNMATPINATIMTEDNVSIEAELIDLSVGGFSARINSELEVQLAENDYLKCTINFPDGELIHSSVSIVRTKEAKQKNKPILAGKFIELETKTKHLLSRLIAKLERENIKLVKRLRDY